MIKERKIEKKTRRETKNSLLCVTKSSSFLFTLYMGKIIKYKLKKIIKYKLILKTKKKSLN